MGDSYTAAPLVPSTDTSDGCLRSSDNYPALVAAALPSADLVDVSCSGADTTSLVGVQQTPSGPKPPQFDALSRRTDLVTIGIGGNDSNLFGTLVGTCSQLRDRDPAGSPCRDRLTGRRPATRSAPRCATSAPTCAPSSPASGTARRAPPWSSSGYPQIVPASGTCPELPLADGRLRLRPADQRGAGRRGARSARRQAPTPTSTSSPPAPGTTSAPPTPGSTGTRPTPTRALAFHPFARGAAGRRRPGQASCGWRP